MVGSTRDEHNGKALETLSSSVDLGTYPFDVLDDFGVDVTTEDVYHDPVLPNNFATSQNGHQEAGVDAPLFPWKLNNEWNNLYSIQEEQSSYLDFQQTEPHIYYYANQTGMHVPDAQIPPADNSNACTVVQPGTTYAADFESGLRECARLALVQLHQSQGEGRPGLHTISTVSSSEYQTNFDHNSDGFETGTINEGPATPLTSPLPSVDGSRVLHNVKPYQGFRSGSSNPWICEYPGCTKEDRSFYTGSELTKHQVYHEPPAHICEHCGYGARLPKDLRRHYRTHKRERPLECEHCQDRFKRSDHVLRHVRESCKKAGLGASRNGRRSGRESSSSATSSNPRPLKPSPAVNDMDIDTFLDYIPSTPPSPTPGAYQLAK